MQTSATVSWCNWRGGTPTSYQANTHAQYTRHIWVSQQHVTLQASANAISTKGGVRRFGMGVGQNYRGCGDGSPPAGSRGGAPLGGSWIIFKVVRPTGKLYTFLRSISHIFTYICLFFFVLAGIIPLSLQNGRGHLIPFASHPLVCKWGEGGGQLPPLPLPGSAACDFNAFAVDYSIG